MLVKEQVSRMPWKEYLSDQLSKLLGLGIITLLLVVTMEYSARLESSILLTVNYSDTNYLTIIIMSSLAFFLVLIGFSKIILFDMAEEFGLRDDKGKIMYNLRFWLLTILALSFCSSIYLLLDVHLIETYLVILPVILMKTGLDSLDFDIPGLSTLNGMEFYQTARNLYFGFFFLIIIGFSIIVFLVILTTFARRRLVRRFSSEVEVADEIEKQGVRAIYKLFLWIVIPPFIYSAITTQISSNWANEDVGLLILLISLLAFVWWIYQVLKVIFLIVWRGVKITAFITSINLLVIIPLIVVLWLLPVCLLSIGDVWDVLRPSVSPPTMDEIINIFLHSFLLRLVDLTELIKLDFIIITSLATLVVGFAEGFALIAIFSALSRGVEVARTGRVLVRSPPKIVVLSKYAIMFGVWLTLLWDSFAGILQMLYRRFGINFGFSVPDFFNTVYKHVITSISDWLYTVLPTMTSLPLLLIPILIIFSGAFKFLSITLITPRVKDRGPVFFLLISTAFVLIITNILGYIYELEISNAPFRSIISFTSLLREAFHTFADVESIAFYGGFFFGIGWVFWRIAHWRKPKRTPVIEAGLQQEADKSPVIEPDVEEETVLEEKVIIKDISEEFADEELWENSIKFKEGTEEE